jgi:hypothetical protein
MILCACIVERKGKCGLVRADAYVTDGFQPEFAILGLSCSAKSLASRKLKHFLSMLTW